MRRTTPLPVRLERSYIPEPNSGCWLWFGALGSSGYGMIKMRGRKLVIGAHRASYEMHKGPIPAGMDLDHLCRVKSCINPNHLEPVSRSENMLRFFRCAERQFNPNEES